MQTGLNTLGKDTTLATPIGVQDSSAVVPAKQPVIDGVVRLSSGKTVDLFKINRSAAGRDMGVSTSMVSRILNGERRPSFDMSRRFQEYLGLDANEMQELLGRIFPSSE